MAQVLDTSVSATHRVRDVRQSFIAIIGMETPVLSRFKKAPKPMSSTPEWPLKTYADAATTGVVEGTPASSAGDENNLSNKTMLLGRFQRRQRQPAASKEAILLSKQYAVPTDVFQDNVKDKTLELHRDLEAIVLSDNESVLPVAGTTASKTRSIPRWVSNDDARFTDAATTPVAAYRTPAASIIVSKATADLVIETEIQGLTSSVATARRKVSTNFWGICQPLMKSTFTSYTRTDLNGQSSSTFPVRRFNQQLGDTISMNVTGYESDFGDIDLMTSFNLDSSVHFLLLDMDMVEIGYAQAPQFTELPYDGATKRGLIDALIVCEVLNPQAHGKAITGATA
jgi:hypothetical protein